MLGGAGPNPYDAGLHPDHVYAVLKYNTKTDKIDLYDPLGERKSVTLSDFCRYFNYLEIEDGL